MDEDVKIGMSQKAAAFRQVLAEKRGEAEADRWTRTFLKAVLEYMNIIKMGMPGRSKAKGIHKEMDRLIVQAKGEGAHKDLSCKKGCSHCCYQRVGVTKDEALLLSDHIKTKEQYEHLERQLSLPDDPEGWIGKPMDLIKCVFLENSLCSIYEDRPTPCRDFFVSSPAENCRMDQEPKTVYPLISIRMETLNSAIMTVEPGRYLHAMAPAILEQIKNKL